MVGYKGIENPMHKAIWIFLSMALFVPLFIIGTNRCYDYCLKRMKKSGDTGAYEVNAVMRNVLHDHGEQFEVELSVKSARNSG